MKPTRTPPRRAGFTLIELMISLIAGSVVIAGAWYMSEMSSRMFNDQLRRADTQMTLRSATAALSRDIARAGLLSVRSSLEMPNCGGAAPVSPVVVNAVTVTAGGALGPTLTLVGNFSSNHQYVADRDTSTPGQLVLVPNVPTFRESFADPATGIFLPARFQAAFQPDPSNPALQGRMVSVQHLETGTIQLRYVTAVNAPPGGPFSIDIDPPLSVGGTAGGCMTNMATLLVAPVSAVRYSVEDPAGDPQLAQIAGAGATGGLRNALIRRELDMSTLGAPVPTPIPGTARVICDFVQLFQVSGVEDTNMVIGGVPTLAYLLNPSVPTTPTSLRSLIVELAANAQSVALAGGNPGTAEQAQGAIAARRAVRFEVFMPNMTRRAGTL